jgi:hypothetical protein
VCLIQVKWLQNLENDAPLDLSLIKVRHGLTDLKNEILDHMDDAASVCFVSKFKCWQLLRSDVTQSTAPFKMAVRKFFTKF